MSDNEENLSGVNEGTPSPHEGLNMGRMRGEAPHKDRRALLIELVANPTTRAILRAIRKDGGMSVTSIQRHVGTSQPNISAALKRMYSLGILERESVGVRHIYYLADTPDARLVMTIIDLISEGTVND